MDAAELLHALTQRVAESTILANELCSRGQDDTENQTETTVMATEALSLTLADANNAATNPDLDILEEIEDPIEEEHR